MSDELETVVSIADAYGRGIGNIVLENCKFFGRPNFAGEENQFKDSRRQFTVRIPLDVVDKLTDIGWNVKTRTPDPGMEGQEPIAFLKVMVDFRFDKEHPGDINYEKGPDVWIIQGEDREKLTSRTVALLDRARFENVDMEIRGWEYNPEENPGMYSARLVTLVAVMRPSLLDQKYGRLQ